MDPQDAYEWQANIKTIMWDGKENFHSLASRIITAVAKYKGDLSEPMKQYFFRFREALPKEFQDAIDMGCSATQRTLTNAKDLAQRTKMTQSSENKSVTFAGTSMDYDRISGLEITLAKIDNRLKTSPHQSTPGLRPKIRESRTLKTISFGRETLHRANTRTLSPHMELLPATGHRAHKVAPTNKGLPQALSPST